MEEANGTKKETSKKGTPKNINIDKNSSAMAKAESDSFTAEVFIKTLPEGGNTVPSESTEIVVTNKVDDEKHAQDLNCLFCGKEIE